MTNLASQRMHDGELTVTAPMVRELVDEQFPQWRDLPVKYLEASGTVNAIFRIGEDLGARFPLVGADVEQTRRVLRAEAEAAAELAAHSRLPVPVPVALGEPGAGYPLPWSVQTWLPGVVADEADPGSSTEFANDLADFIQDLRAVDTRGRVFSGQGRGGDLRAHDAWMDTCFERSEELLDVPALRRVWAEMRELPRYAPDVMTHGDLIPGNVLVTDGRLAGVLDTGGFGAADPALELVAAWHLLEDGPRSVLRERLGCDDLEWRRGRAWAFEQAMGLVWYYPQTNPTMARTGRRTLARILAEPGAE